MAGATALVNKPAKDMLGDWIQPLINNIDSLTGLETPRKKSRPRISRTRQVLSKKPRPGKFKAVGIASSTGGPMALEHILKNLKPQFSASILIVQHITPGFSLELVNWYNKISPLEVRLAQKGDRLQPACVYLAPDNQHMEVTNHHITLHSKPQVCGFRPSGTVLLSSLAQNFPNQSLGIILTGMGKDGVEGMTQIKETGGYTIAQDKDSSVVFGMPARAIEAGAIDVVASLEEIPQMINQMVA